MATFAKLASSAASFGGNRKEEYVRAQVPEQQMINIASMLQWQFHRHAALLRGVMTPREHKMVAAFVQARG